MSEENENDLIDILEKKLKEYRKGYNNIVEKEIRDDELKEINVILRSYMKYFEELS